MVVGRRIVLYLVVVVLLWFRLVVLLLLVIRMLIVLGLRRCSILARCRNVVSWLSRLLILVVRSWVGYLPICRRSTLIFLIRLRVGWLRFTFRIFLVERRLSIPVVELSSLATSFVYNEVENTFKTVWWSVEASIVVYTCHEASPANDGLIDNSRDATC